MLHFHATEPFDIFTQRLIFDVSQGGYQSSIELSGTGALHDVARNLNWDFFSLDGVLALAEHPDASRATVLLLYWRCAGYYLQYASRAEVPEFQQDGYDFCQALERLFESKPDRGDGIGYDPRNDGGDRTTMYADTPQRRAAPAHMLVPVPGAMRPDLTDTDWTGRPPTTAERAAIAAGIARGRALLQHLPHDAAGRDIIVAIADAMRDAVPVDDDLAWLWLDQLGWDWQCTDSPDDGVLFGVCRGPFSLVVPDIIRNTRKAGVDPWRIVDAFDLLVQPRTVETNAAIKDLVWHEFPFAYFDELDFSDEPL